jgi:outer membrane biosynthesis protein TonB
MLIEILSKSDCKNLDKPLNIARLPKMLIRKRTFGAILALVSFAAFPALGADASRFSVAIGSGDHLLIVDSNGQQIADVPAPTLQRNVTVGGDAFQLSYGRDANGELTAVLTPPDSSEVALHFTAGGRSIDASKAIVTLIFSSQTKGVLVDPGYIGTVEVDSHLLRPHSLADDQPLPAAITSVQSVTPETPDAAPTPAPVASVQPIPEPAPAPDPAASVATTPVPAPEPAPVPVPPTPPAPPAPESNPASSGTVALNPISPPLLASQLTPILAPTANAVPNPPPSVTPYHSTIPDALATSAAPVEGVQRMKLYWSEPITGPDGSAPPVAADEIKLVELHGEVTVVLPSGDIQAGREGLAVPSGSTVRTSDNSSVALFLGGVNSARLMPKCELVVTQTVAASLRTDVINLHYGAVFTRIGHRDGETENLSITTPEGTTDAPTSDMLAFRGNPAQLRHAVSTTRAGFSLDHANLLAWNPTPSRGLISDVAQADLGIQTPIGFIPDTYFYFTGAYKIAVNATQIRHEVLTNLTPNATPSDTEPDYVLQSILQMLQPYNTKLNKLLSAINNGTETPAQLTYYHNLVTVFFDQQATGIVNTVIHHPNGYVHILNQDSAMLWQDLREFQINVLTPK